MKKYSGFRSLALFASVLALAGISCGVADISNIFATATLTPPLLLHPAPLHAQPNVHLKPTRTPHQLHYRAVPQPKSSGWLNALY